MRVPGSLTQPIHSAALREKPDMLGTDSTKITDCLSREKIDTLFITKLDRLMREVSAKEGFSYQRLTRTSWHAYTNEIKTTFIEDDEKGLEYLDKLLPSLGGQWNIKPPAIAKGQEFLERISALIRPTATTPPRWPNHKSGRASGSEDLSPTPPSSPDSPTEDATSAGAGAGAGSAKAKTSIPDELPSTSADSSSSDSEWGDSDDETGLFGQMSPERQNSTRAESPATEELRESPKSVASPLQEPFIPKVTRKQFLNNF